MPRVLIAGYQHETNTFAPSLADWSAFTRGDSFPAFVQGQAMVDQLASVNIPTSIKVETRNQVEVVINGASVLAAIKGDLAREVTDQVISTLQTQVTQIISNMPMRG
jgi:microcystin degradation protein MlrC